MSDELRRAFNRAVWGAADDEGQPARLGRRDGTLRYIDALGNSYADRVWVTLDGNHGQSETVARCTTVPHVRNLPVRVAMRRGLLTVIGTDGSWAAQYSGNRPIGAGPHAWMHGRLAPDALYVEGLQVLPLMATPTTPPSMAVRVQQAVYRYGGTLKLWGTGDSADLSAYIPASSSVQHFVIVCLDRANNALVVVDGDDSGAGDNAYQQPGTYNQPFTATDVATIAIPDAYYPVCAVRFYHGMTRILAPDIIFDWRLWGGERGALDAGEITSGTLALERGGTEADLSATGPGLVQQRTAGAALSVVKCEFGGTAPPGTGDDETAGYAVGSRWLDTTNGAEYVCLDASAGAAVWIETTGGGGTLPDHDHSGDAGDGGTFDAANLTSGAASNGDVLTADGAGGAAWEAPAAAGGTLSVINGSGASAAQGDVGLLEWNATYGYRFVTTTTAYADGQWCVVDEGGANGTVIEVRVTGSGVPVAYTGTAPAIGDFLVTSTTAGKAQREAGGHYNMFAVCTSAGGGGLVTATLLTRRAIKPAASDNDILRVNASSSFGTAPWTGTINDATPTANPVTVATTTGSIADITPAASTQLGKMVIRNLTRGNEALISSISGNNITFVSVPANWANGDSLTALADITGGSARCIDLSLSSAIPRTAVSLGLAVTFRDTGGPPNQNSTTHPFENWPASNSKAAYVTAQSTDFIRANYPVPLVRRRFVHQNTASGAGTATFIYRLQYIVEAVP